MLYLVLTQPGTPPPVQSSGQARSGWTRNTDICRQIICAVLCCGAGRGVADPLHWLELQLGQGSGGLTKHQPCLQSGREELCRGLLQHPPSVWTSRPGGAFSAQPGGRASCSPTDLVAFMMTDGNLARTAREPGLLSWRPGFLSSWTP